MKKLVLLAVATLVAGAASAQDKGPVMKLAEAKTCMACHGLDKKLVGPGYNEVAAKYKGSKDMTAAKLGEKIKNGGSGSFGAVAMPANNVTKDEAEKLAAWILAGADPKK